MFAFLVAILQEAGEGGAEGFVSPFEINFGLFFWTWVVFIALFFVLKKYAWPSILRATEERERRIAKQLDDAERMNAEAKQAMEEHKKLMTNAKDEAHSLIAEAKSVGEKQREQMLAKTRAEQEQMLDRAKLEIDAERERALMQLRKEAVDLSLAAASKLIQERLESAADRKIVEEYLTSLEDER